MSNIVLQPNASGTGSITIATPNTNTDRTLNIPDVAGNLVTTGDTGSVTSGMIDSMTASKLTGALPAISGAALTGIAPLSGGIPQKISSTVSAVTFTGIPSTAKIIYLSWFNATAPAQFYIRLRVGGATITSGYLTSLTYQYAGSVSNSYNTAGGSRYDTSAIQWGSWGAASPFNGFAVIARNDAVTDTDYSYSITGQTQFESYNTYGGMGFAAGKYDASAAVDGIEFTGNSNLTAGTFNVWYQ